jgi:hypothetical protein
MQIPFRLRPKVMGYDPGARAIGGGGGGNNDTILYDPTTYSISASGEGGGSSLIPYKLPFKEAPPDQRP